MKREKSGTNSFFYFSVPIYELIIFLCCLSNCQKKKKNFPQSKTFSPVICLPLFCCFDRNLSPFVPISNIPYASSYLKQDPIYMVAFQENFSNQTQQQSTKKSYLLGKHYWSSLWIYPPLRIQVSDKNLPKNIKSYKWKINSSVDFLVFASVQSSYYIKKIIPKV
jgi:hypothetical protein